MKTGENAGNLEILKKAEEYLKGSPRVAFDPYPDYDGRVMLVFGTLKEDINYLKNCDIIGDKSIEEMSLKEIASMYTFIVRGERFSDGHIALFIEDGRLLKLVRRHMELIEKREGRGRAKCRTSTSPMRQ